VEIGPVVTTASATKDGILLQVIDGPAGLVYQKVFHWDDLKLFLQEHGKTIPIGEFVRGGASGIRGMMEMDPE
jgi:hypothetical protein